MALITKLDIKPETVESVYTLYRKKMLLVNRKYQRKLVWTIEEKEKFIDSLYKSLPIPLILSAITKYKDNSVYEIIDGMQRLNSIISFIENEIYLDGKYFNLETFALTKKLKDERRLTQKTPVMTIDECLKVTTYQIPFSVTTYDSEKEIEEIFRRINSYGKTLASHELRQAGSLSSFNNIVRTLAENIRKDVSPSDKILLGNMRNISINNRGMKYGIDLRDIFWYKQNILTEINIRASRDEELIAHLILAILMDNEINISSTSLDRAYGLSDEDDNIDTDRLISKKGGEAFLISLFETIFSEINSVLNEGSDNFQKLLFKKDSKYLNYAYQVVFLAFYELLVKREMKINNYKNLNKKLSGIGDTLILPHIDNIRHRSSRQRCIDSIVGVIEKNFVKREEADPTLSNGIIKLESLLASAKAENTSYDFKQGIFQMDKQNKHIIPKIVETLGAFVNQGKNAVGYIVLGIADNENLANAHKRFYNSTFKKKENFYIVGIEDEVKAKSLTVDDYMLKIKDYIKSQDIQPEYYKTQILKNIDLFTYEDKSIIIIKIASKDDPFKLNNKFYHRQASSTEEVPSSSEKQLWSLFLN
ncbi:Putative DNA-binding domain-containing protein [Myroides marinus]|uniref:Putative DNA-binding domain-containing protein n=1 Tax=Myroides marinus TaxID=703342 RepID=A0A1H6YAC2_9FLAO|nr:DUF262 domain-containing protein [Myroides marinus]SEJ38201.1 Putative DNA-binding domain-containing protein [Myroides marinus]